MTQFVIATGVVSQDSNQPRVQYHSLIDVDTSTAYATILVDVARKTTTMNVNEAIPYPVYSRIFEFVASYLTPSMSMLLLGASAQRFAAWVASTAADQRVVKDGPFLFDLTLTAMQGDTAVASIRQTKRELFASVLENNKNGTFEYRLVITKGM